MRLNEKTEEFFLKEFAKTAKMIEDVTSIEDVTDSIYMSFRSLEDMEDMPISEEKYNEYEKIFNFISFYLAERAESNENYMSESYIYPKLRGILIPIIKEHDFFNDSCKCEKWFNN